MSETDWVAKTLRKHEWHSAADHVELLVQTIEMLRHREGIESDEAELLTPAEETVIRILGTSGSLFASMIVKQGSTRDNDAREFSDGIHRLQQMILSQAAARAYPDRYRLLGADPLPEWKDEKFK